MLRSKFLVRRLHGGLRGHVKVAEEVRHALEEGMPVVALESTIITHGMPHPMNVECAMGCERRIRENGAIPATIAILKGKITVGLSPSQIEMIGDVATTRCVKTSRRDLPHVVGSGMNGGTTVSGTLIAADLAGIPIFATGGIGGVHRMGETTMDVSADLVELGRTPVAVVSSGIKSILDIPRTLEYLETQGVFVATFGATKRFPAFYTRDSGCEAPYSVATPEEAAGIIRAARDLRLTSGLLFGVPIPRDHAMDEKLIGGAIEEALKMAADGGIRGKEVTPFLLSHISKVTAGSSLASNVALVQNNAKVAAEIARALSERRSTTEKKSNIVVIGGSILDRCATSNTTNLKLDGSIYTGKITENPGGVARNICEALGKLGSPPTFITAVGDDESGDLLARSLPPNAIKRVPNTKTAQCVVVLDGKGDCNMLIGDMEAHGWITPELIRERETDIQMAPLIVLDGNPPLESVGVLLGLAAEHGVPVFYEPTDVPIASKPFKTQFWRSIKFVTPNVSELKQIAAHFNIPTTSDTDIRSVAVIARKLAAQIDNVIVTMGEHGILIARRGQADKPFITSEASFNNSFIRNKTSLSTEEAKLPTEKGKLPMEERLSRFTDTVDSRASFSTDTEEATLSTEEAKLSTEKVKLSMEERLSRFTDTVDSRASFSTDTEEATLSTEEAKLSTEKVKLSMEERLSRFTDTVDSRASFSTDKVSVSTNKTSLSIGKASLSADKGSLSIDKDFSLSNNNNNNNTSSSPCVSEVQVRHYPALDVERVVNVSGAGDCFAAGLIGGILRGFSEEECVELGLKCAAKALGALGTVPEALHDVELEKHIKYKVIE